MQTNNKKLLVNKILVARKGQGFTQKQVADKVAAMLNQTYSQRQYAKLEAGNFPIYKTKILQAVLQILGITQNKPDDVSASSFHQSVLEFFPKAITLLESINIKLDTLINIAVKNNAA